MNSGQWSVSSGQWAVGSRQCLRGRRRASHYPLATSHYPLGFTLVEMLVTISIIAILSGLVFGALQAARATAREDATKATIAKLHNILMARYESYMTRRVPISMQGLSPADAAKVKLYAIRDLMRMEMPDRSDDINLGPIVITTSTGATRQLARPALWQLYYNRLHNSPPMVNGAPQANGQNGPAELLYMIVSMGSPEAMEQFSQTEIGDTDHNGYPEFLDGWGRPIFFLRWAPGFSAPLSDIQVADPINNHDPFDPRRVDPNAYHLIPLIYSNGSNAGDKNHGLNVVDGYSFAGTSPPGEMFSDPTNTFQKIGSVLGITSFGGITNHHIEQR